MQHALNCPPLIVPDMEASPVFSVVIAYEDFETGKHAKRIYDFLVENLGHDCMFVNQMWKFDVLSIAKLREIAIEDAAKADIILVSSHGLDLPEHVKLWTEAWLQHEPHPLALVALFDRMSETQAVRDYLQEVARRGDMEFFAQPEALTESREPDLQLSGSAGARLNTSTRALSALAGAVQQDEVAPRWGINE
jgi:hypothetical protein